MRSLQDAYKDNLDKISLHIYYHKKIVGYRAFDDKAQEACKDHINNSEYWEYIKTIVVSL